MPPVLENSLTPVQLLHIIPVMPTLHRLQNMTIRVNIPDHNPPHVHVVTADRRDALVDLETLEVTSRMLRAADIAEAMAWIADNREEAKRIFKECNP